MCTKVDPKKPVFEYFKTAADVPKIYSGMTFTIDFFLSMVQKFVNWFHVYLGTPAFVVHMQPYPDAAQFILDCDVMARDFERGKRSYDHANGEDFYELLDRSNRIMTDIPSNTPEGREARKSIVMARAMMKTVGSKLARSNITGNGPRIPPVPVMICGTTGVGKSDFMPFLINEVTARVLPEKDLDKFVANSNDATFVRNAENHFWDGYHGQFNVYDDDIGQVVDVAGVSDNSFMEHIRMIGPSNFPLNMANLEDKGNVNFRSKMVWCSTNNFKFEFKSLTTNAPFCGRYKLAYAMIPKIEYCKHRNGDKNSVDLFPENRVMDQKCFPSNRLDYSYVEFRRVDIATGKFLDEVLDYKQLVEKIVAEYDSRNRTGKRTLELHQVAKEQAVAHRLALKKSSADVQSVIDDLAKKHAEKMNNPPDLNIKPQSGGKHHKDPTRVSDLPGLSKEGEKDPAPQDDCDNDDLDEDEEDDDTGLDDILWSVKFIKTMPRFLRTRYSIELREGQVDSTFILEHLANETKIPIGFIRRKAQVSMGSYEFMIAELQVAYDLENGKSKYSSKWSRLRMRFRNMWRYFLDILKDIKPYVTIMFMSALQTVGIFIFINLICKVLLFFLPPVEPQSWSGARHGTGHVNQKPQVERRVNGKAFRSFDFSGGRAPAKSQMSDDNASQIYKSVRKRNVYELHNPDSTKRSGYLIFIKDHIALMPMHFGESLKADFDSGRLDPDSKVMLVSALGEKSYYALSSLDFKATTYSNDNDWCLVKFPTLGNRHRNVIEYFAKDDRDYYDNLEMIISRTENGDTHYQHVFGSPIKKPVSYEGYSISQGFHYDINTVSGECGTPIVLCDSTHSKQKFIGIHTAGNGNVGFCPLITQEAIKEVLEGFGPHEGYDSREEFVDVVKQASHLEDSIDVPGFQVVAEGRDVNTPKETKIIPSKLHDTYIKSEMAPANLRPFKRNGVDVDPMDKARKRYLKDRYALDVDILEAARRVVTQNITNNSTNGAPWNKKIFTFEEAVSGVQGVKFMEGIPRTTGAGYPLSLDVPPQYKGKQHIFGKTGDYNFETELCKEVRAEVDSLINNASKGIRSLNVYIDFLKDERKPIAKVLEGKSRLVSSCPLALLIAHRMYFLDFVRWIMHNRIKNGCAVGVNATSDEWEVLAKHMCFGSIETVVKQIIAGDYSFFDGSITVQIMNVVLCMINEWYSDENSRTREVLWLDVTHSRHIFRRFIYQWKACNPSGTFVTTILNSLVNALLIAYAFIKLYVGTENPVHGSTEYFALINKAILLFKKHIYSICYGDDNLIAVSSFVAHFFNQDTFTEVLKGMGFTYTSESKDGEFVAPLRSLDEVSFLKRRFVRSELNGRMLCPLQLSVILETPMWTTSLGSKRGDDKESVQTALFELSLHSRAVFDTWAPNIIAASLKYLNYAPEITDYRNLQYTKMNSVLGAE